MSVIKEVALQGTKSRKALWASRLSFISCKYCQWKFIILSVRENECPLSSEQSQKHTMKWAAQLWSQAAMAKMSVAMDQWADVDVHAGIHFLLSDRIFPLCVQSYSFLARNHPIKGCFRISGYKTTAWLRSLFAYRPPKNYVRFYSRVFQAFWGGENG